MTTLGGLSRNMKILASSVGVSRIDLVKKVARAVGSELIPRTPVDTSRARMNWQSSVGTPKTGVLLPYPSQPSGPSDGASVAMRSLEAAIGAYSGQAGGIWIVNNLNYIGSLNNGSSSQAPANFVQIAVMSGAQKVATIKLIP